MYFRTLKKTAGEFSINDPLETDKDGNPLTLMDLLADEQSLTETVDLRIRSERLYACLERALSPRERIIIILRYGLYGRRACTQREIARMLAISRSYVSRIEKKALEELKKALEKENI